MTYQRLTAEIDRCKATAQAFLNYKRGDCTFDDFVMFAMENNNAPSDYARDFFESLRNRTMEGSNSAINGLMDYDGIFEAVINGGVWPSLTEGELNDLWEFGVDYSTKMFQKLVY